MSDQGLQVAAARGNHTHQAPHALLAARTQGGDDLVITKPRRERPERDLQIARVHAQTRERATRPQYAQAGLEGRLSAERFDGDVHATLTRQTQDLICRIPECC